MQSPSSSALIKNDETSTSMYNLLKKFDKIIILLDISHFHCCWDPFGCYDYSKKN